MKENSDSPLNDIKLGEVTAQWCKSQKIPVNYIASVASTNNWAKENAFHDESFENELVVFLTDHQSSGRGRFDKEWLPTRPGSSLLSSWSFLVEETPSPYITARIGLALFNAASATWRFLPWSLKAPNDLFLRDKKISGILTETVSQGEDHRLIVGIGLNVLNSPERLDTATNLLNHLTNKTPLLGEDWIAFLDRFLMELTLVMSSAHEVPSATEQQNLVEALNLNPLLEKKFSSFKEVSSELTRL